MYNVKISSRTKGSIEFEIEASSLGEATRLAKQRFRLSNKYLTDKKRR